MNWEDGDGEEDGDDSVLEEYNRCVERAVRKEKKENNLFVRSIENFQLQPHCAFIIRQP